MKQHNEEIKAKEKWRSDKQDNVREMSVHERHWSMVKHSNPSPTTTTAATADME